jgi:tetratricopeptide (TPR) repeat protein
MKSIKLISLFVVLFAFVVSCNSGDKSKTDKKAAVDNTELTSTKQEETPGNELAELNLKIKNDPENALLYHERAQFHYGNVMIDFAMSDIAKAIQLDDSNSDFFVTLGDIYIIMSSFDDALASYNRALKLDSKNIRGLTQLAKLQIAKQEYMPARTQLDKIVNIDPDNANAYYLFGIILLERGDTLKAIRNLNQSIDLDPESIDPYRELGLIYSAQGNIAALDYFNSMTNINPNDQTPVYLKAMFYQEQGEFEKAENLYYNMIQMDSTNSLPYYNLGYLHLVYAGQYNEAVTFFTRAIERDPHSIDAYYNRGYSYELLGKYNLAKNDYSKTIAMNPKYENGIAGLRRINKALN